LGLANGEQGAKRERPQDFAHYVTLNSPHRHAELGSASIAQPTRILKGKMDPGAEGVQSTTKFRVTVVGEAQSPPAIAPA